MRNGQQLIKFSRDVEDSDPFSEVIWGLRRGISKLSRAVLIPLTFQGTYVFLSTSIKHLSLLLDLVIFFWPMPSQRYTPLYEVELRAGADS
jgi:hypothetical protein